MCDFIYFLRQNKFNCHSINCHAINCLHEYYVIPFKWFAFKWLRLTVLRLSDVRLSVYKSSQPLNPCRIPGLGFDQVTLWLVSRYVSVGVVRYPWPQISAAHAVVCVQLLYCIVFIHFYSSSHSLSFLEALPTTAIDTVSEFTRRSATGNCKWRTSPRSIRGV